MTKQIFLPSDGPTGTPSLRTLGTGAQQAAAGNDGRLSDSRLPLVHASTHDVGGADVLKDLTRLSAGPAMNGYTAWDYDIALATGNTAPSAGVIYLIKLLTAHAYTVNSIDFDVGVTGTGATALANCYVGIYDSGGTRRFVSADQSAAWAASTGLKSLAVSGGYLVTANDYIYIAVLVGTQSTTTVKFGQYGVLASLANLNLAAGAVRFGSQGTAQTSLPSPTITLASNANATGNFCPWFAVK